MAIENNTDYTLKGSQVLALRDYVNAAMNLPGTVIGSGAPTTATEGNVGQFYYDTTNDKFYYCEAKTAQGTTPETYLYTWTLQVSGPTVVQTTGTSTTDVMSQNATTSMVFADPSTMQLVQIGKDANAGNYQFSTSGRIAIGKGATATGNDGNIAIGKDANSTTSSHRSISIGGAGNTKNSSLNIGGITYNSTGDRGTIIGIDARPDGYGIENFVCVGYSATATRSGEMNIGAGTSGRGYNSTNYRVLGGVHDPVDAHDAATKGYVDGLVGNIAAALNVINNGGNS